MTSRMASTTTSTSPFIAIFTAAAVVGVGIAYWSSESSTTAFGTIVLGILRATGTLGGKEIKDNNERNNKSNNNNTDKDDNVQRNKADDLKIAFVTWLDREENENDLSRSKNNYSRCKENNLADPRWMSETVRAFLFSSNGTSTMSGNSTSPLLLEEGSSIALLTSPSEETEKLTRNTALAAHITTPMDIKEETKNEKAFRRAFGRFFRTLQKATQELIQKEPVIREAFFNGIVVDEEVENSDEESKEERRRSLSLSSRSSSWSTESYEVDTENCLVEEEEEVERLLTYLRFVDLAKEASPSSSSSSSSTSPKSYLGRATGYLRRQKKRIIRDSEGYEHLNCSTIQIQNKTESRRAKVDYMAAVHRDRKELVIAINYDESLRSSTTVDDRSEIMDILTKSLILQHQGNDEIHVAPSPSGSFLLLDQAAKKLYEEILLRYLNTNKGGETEIFYSIESSGYTLVLCGHSLGAALTCRLGDMFTHRNRDPILDSFQVRVYAFGPPPCLPSRQESSQDGSDDGKYYSYIISVVNNHDCVPRWTESNLAGLRTSLRWTMDQKKRHFLRHHNKYNQYRPPVNSTTGTDAKRRPTPQIPPFLLSPRDLNIFWKSSQKPNDAILSQDDDNKADSKYIVPGKVVLIWNHSQDPTIIGAKVHVSGTKNRHLSSSSFNQLLHCPQDNHKNQHDVLGRLWVDESMFSDHTIESYRSNLELLLGQVGNTI